MTLCAVVREFTRCLFIWRVDGALHNFFGVEVGVGGGGRYDLPSVALLMPSRGGERGMGRDWTALGVGGGGRGVPLTHKHVGKYVDYVVILF